MSDVGTLEVAIGQLDYRCWTSVQYTNTELGKALRFALLGDTSSRNPLGEKILEKAPGLPAKWQEVAKNFVTPSNAGMRWSEEWQADYWQMDSVVETENAKKAIELLIPALKEAGITWSPIGDYRLLPGFMPNVF